MSHHLHLLIVRRLIFSIGLFAFIGCFVLVLNITAPNPTHRRYSSRIPLTTSISNSSQSIGLDGETVLSADLGLPSNNAADQRLCFCRGANLKPDNCVGCAAYYAALTASFRMPDFISSRVIVESKNRQTLAQDDHDLLNQIGDYSLVAISLHRPLWIYVRVNSEVDPIYEQLAAATQGGLVRYFNVSGYSDPIDQAATVGLVLSGTMVLIIGLWELILYRRRMRVQRASYVALSPVPQLGRPTDNRRSLPKPRSFPGREDTHNAGSPSPKVPPRLPGSPASPLSKTIEALENANKAAKQTREKLN